MPDYTLAPTETHIREAHLYAQIPSLLTITSDGENPVQLRNDSPTPITITPHNPAAPNNPTALLPTVLAAGQTTPLTAGTWAIVCNTNGRFTAQRT